MTRSPKENIIDVVQEAFTAYGFRWKIEEHHRHIKQCYHMEDIQIKTFERLQSMLAILTIAMGIIYMSLSSMHVKLLLGSGVKTLNNEKIYELTNFIYYKNTARKYETKCFFSLAANLQKRRTVKPCTKL